MFLLVSEDEDELDTDDVDDRYAVPISKDFSSSESFASVGRFFAYMVLNN